MTGVGKSAHPGQDGCDLNSTGTRSLFLHAGEALHGDVGAVNAEDVILCLRKAAERRGDAIASHIDQPPSASWR